MSRSTVINPDTPNKHKYSRSDNTEYSKDDVTVCLTNPQKKTPIKSAIKSDKILSLLKKEVIKELIDDFSSIYGCEPSKSVLKSMIQEKLQHLISVGAFKESQEHIHNIIATTSQATQATSNTKKRKQLSGNQNDDSDDDNINTSDLNDSQSDAILSVDLHNTSVDSIDQSEQDHEQLNFDDYDNEIEFLLNSMNVHEEDAPSYIN